MSTLTTDQMLQEAIEPLNNRFKYINEQAAISGRKGYHEYLDPSFDFIASDGHTLSVKFFRNPNPGAAAELKATNNQQLYTVISKTGILSGYPCLTTGQGDLIFVHDPTESCADKIIQSHNKFTDPQEWWLDRKRPHMDKGAEHIPRPMNAFIIYRNAQMATVRQQHPGIGNNDVSRIIGKKWQALDPKSRAHYKSLASRSAQEHSAKHPGYKYTPRKSEDVVRRRKRSGVALEAKPKRIRNRRIHHGTDSIEVPLTPVQPTTAEFPDLDSLTNAWAEDPTPAHFEALMNGFDCALEFTAL